MTVYGSPADVAVTGRYVPDEEFRGVLENAPAGLFTQEAWRKWHERFGMPVPPRPAETPVPRRLARPRARAACLEEVIPSVGSLLRLLLFRSKRK